MSYYELQKIRRESDFNFVTETVIANEHKKVVYRSLVMCSEPGTKSSAFEIQRSYGAGLRLNISKDTGKRMMQQSFEIGKSEVKMLLDYLNEVYPELRDYNGTYVPVALTDLRSDKEKAASTD